ncbi:MAG: class I SAM-dependent methyltransferase [Bacteroidales bacterium]|jgi:predicted O-methyltransferase YrrM
MNQLLLQINSYLRYLLSAKTRYTIHSPFVYNLVNDVLRDTTRHKDFSTLEAVRKKLLSNTNLVETVDMGAGAGKKKYTTAVFPVGKLVKLRSQRKTQIEMLYRLVKYLKPNTILEFGTAAGVSGSYLKMAWPASKMITMEGCSGLAAVAESVFSDLNLSDIQVSVGDFDAILPSVLQQVDRLDFVFFDGNHRKEPTLNYFNQCLPLANESSVFIFDDIHWSPGMEAAWAEIKKHKEVSITIDLFWCGMVFFRKGIEKQNFIIRP